MRYTKHSLWDTDYESDEITVSLTLVWYELFVPGTTKMSTKTQTRWYIFDNIGQPLKLGEQSVDEGISESANVSLMIGV